MEEKRDRPHLMSQIFMRAKMVPSKTVNRKEVGDAAAPDAGAAAGAAKPAGKMYAQLPIKSNRPLP
jgi:hypothetical protein